MAQAGAIAGHGLDASFVEAATRGEPATPDVGVAIEAHRVVDAMYRSAAGGGHRIDLGPT